MGKTKTLLKNEEKEHKILMISDLDGTLLTDNKELSEHTEQTINRLIDEGMYFSVATARTAETVRKLLQRVHVNVPVVLMNGVCIYDLNHKKYVRIESIDPKAVQRMISVIEDLNLSGFLYAIQGDRLQTFYENTDSPHATEFIRERIEGFGKVFTKVNNFTDCLDCNIVYYSIADREERLRKAYESILSIDGLRSEFYRDTYHEGFWYLEICSDKASKYKAVEFLRNQYRFDKVFGFGDNLNDLPLFAACDRSFAVANARPEVKAKACKVIGSNQEDGVAKWLTSNTLF